MLPPIAPIGDGPQYSLRPCYDTRCDMMATTLACPTCAEPVRLADRFCSRCGDELSLTSHPTALLDDIHPEDDPSSPWAEVVQRLRRATAGEFEVGRELGRGGMAAVFLAHEVSLDRKVAIKVMSPGLLMGDGMIDRFKREAITIAHLNHPNIVSCYSVRQAAGLHFFVMRYIRGRSLDQLIHDSGRLPLPIARSILCQVSSALTYAHRSRVVHRDIKPANILIDEDGNAVVTDFGIAKVAELPSHTHTGALVGTPAYMSPEQCSGEDVSGTSDQYSLGAVAYEMVAGTAPFTGSTLTVMQSQVEHAPPPIRDHCPECPADLEAAILRMLAKDPAERFPNMAEAKAALGAVPLMEDDPLLAELSRLAAPATSATPTDARPSGRQSPVPASTPSSSRSAIGGRARSITILPPPAELATGDGFALVALVRGDRGVPLPGRAIEWTTDAPDVLHIDRNRGTATAVAAGTALLSASCEGVQARVPVFVPAAGIEPLDPATDRRAASIQISAAPKSLRAGDSFVLTATPLDTSGMPLSEGSVLWSSSDVGVAVVAAGGWVAALGRGQVVLTATRDEASASVTVEVGHAIPTSRPHRPPPTSTVPSAEDSEPARRARWRRKGSRLRKAMLQGSAGTIVVVGSLYMFGGLRDFSWPAGGASAIPADTVAGIALPPGSVKADSVPPISRGATPSPVPRRIRRAPRAAPAEPASVSIAPHDPVATGDTVTLTAEVLDAQGAPIADAGVTWRSSQPNLAAVDSTTGRVSAKAPGTALITALSGEEFATSYLRVLPDAAALPDTQGYAPVSPEASSETEPQEVALAPTSPPRASAPPRRAAPTPAPEPFDRRHLESRMRQGVDECYGAIRSKDVERVTRMYQPKSYADEDKLTRLVRILRTEPWKAAVGKRVDGARELSATAAAAEFSFRLGWTGMHGGRLRSQPIFRAEFSRSGEDWTMSSCRIVGSPKL